MNLEAVYFISQILAAAGIIGSLIFVGIQMRQTRDAQRQQAEESRFQTMSELMAEYRNILQFVVSDEKLGIAFIASGKDGIAGLDSIERLRVLAFTSLAFRTYEQAFLHHKASRINDDAWEAFEGMMHANISHRGMEEYFEMRREIFSTSFVEYFDRLRAEEKDLNTALWERTPEAKTEEPETE